MGRGPAIAPLDPHDPKTIRIGPLRRSATGRNVSVVNSKEPTRTQGLLLKKGPKPVPCGFRVAIGFLVLVGALLTGLVIW